MSVSYETTGRTRQKARTRAALVEAARELLAGGVTPTVEQVAAAASVSRPTAYRYFPNRRALLAAVHPEIDAASLLGDDPPADPQARFELAVDRLIALVIENEPELRASLRASLDSPATDGDGLSFRRGRAVGWLEDALAPLDERMSAPAVRRLAVATRAACGIEPLIWLTDIAGLTREEAAQTMRWSARALFRAAMDELPGR